MNYEKIYKSLIIKRLNHPANLNYQYTQTHHILPRSIDPSQAKNKNNLVILSAREHFIAHALLVKITQKSQNRENYYKMIYAFQNMNRNANKQRYINSHLYQLMKYKYSQIRKELIKYINPSKGKIWICNLELEENKLWDKNQQIPEGWIKRRIKDFKLYKNKIKIKQEKKFQLKQKDQEKIKLAKQYFEQYKLNGYKGVVLKFNYPYSIESLRQYFNRHIFEQYNQLKILRKKYRIK